jgi:hypothetical protein
MLAENLKEWQIKTGKSKCETKNFKYENKGVRVGF